MKAFSTLAMLAALLMFSALGCSDATDAPETTPPATDTDTDTPADPGAADTEPGLDE